MTYTPSNAKLRLNAQRGLTHAYGTLAQTVSGVMGSNTLTASATLATAAIRTGSVINVGASNDPYTVASVVTTTITTVEPLTTTYIALTALKVDAVETWAGNEGFGSSATQATAANRPAYIPSVTDAAARVGIEFTAAAKALPLTNTAIDNIFAGGGTVSFVIGANDAGGGSAGRVMEKVDGGGTAAWNIVTTTASGGFYRILFNQVTSGTAGAWTTGSVVALTIPQIVTLTYNSTTPTVAPVIRVVGLDVPITETATPTGTAVSDAGGALTIGNRAAGDRGLNGRLFELYMWGTIRNNWDLTKLDKYWANKYAITLFDNSAQFYGARAYDVSFPAAGTRPLILNLHGGGGDADTFETQLQYGTLVGDVAVLVFPTATKNVNGTNTWNSGGAQTFNEAPDSEYLVNLINHVTAEALSRGITVSDVYVVGHSNGGMMAYRLVIEHPEVFAGVFAISADVMIDNPNTFTGKLKHIHGENDANVPLAGGVGSGGIYYTPVIATVQEFTLVNGGTGVTSGSDLTDDFITLAGAEHIMSSLGTVLAAVPYETTFAELILDFITA